MKKTVLVVSVILLLFVYGGLHIFSSKIIHPPWYKHFPGQKLQEIHKTSSRFEILKGIVTDPKIDHNIEYEDIFMDSFQNDKSIMLHGWYIKSKKPQKEKVGVIFAHGAGNDRRHYLRHLELYHEENFECLLFDFNAHGSSGGDSLGVSYGLREHVDILNVVKFAKTKLGWNKVILSGNSVGAAAVIIAAALDQKSIDIVIAENPFSDVFDLWMYAINRLLGNEDFGKSSTESFGYATMFLTKISKIIPKALINSFLNFTYWRIAGTKEYHEWSPKALVSNISQPIMFLHGKRDTVIPYEHSEELYKLASEPKKLWTCEFSGHGQIYNGGKERYRENVINQFINKYLK
eukprot:gene2511-3217_t